MERIPRRQLKQILEALKRDKADGSSEKTSTISNEKDNELLDAGTEKNDRLYAKEDEPGWIIRMMKPIRHRYSSSFTMHALDHIINGTFPEKVFWTAKLFLVLGIAIFMCRHLFVSFFKHQVDTNLMYKPKTEMALPLVFICGNTVQGWNVERGTWNVERGMLAWQCDCNPRALSYDKTVCESLSKKCPSFCKDDPDEEDCKADLIEQGVSCDERLLGQCVVLNRDGKLMQTLTESGMSYKHKVRSKDFPLWVFAKPQGNVELMPTPGIEMRWTQINQPGQYYFSVQETTINRLPYPYNKEKPCATEDSEIAKKNNMFHGNYTIDKCLGTCWTRAQLKYCGTTFSITRMQAKDQESLKKQLQNKTQEQLHDCLHLHHDMIYEDLHGCSLGCPTPCDEESFLMSVRYEPSSQIGDGNVTLFFSYLEMTERMIDETPSYHFSTLFANFGGTLGLMTGMSAISVAELSIWFIMFVIDRVNRMKKFVKK